MRDQPTAGKKNCNTGTIPQRRKKEKGLDERKEKSYEHDADHSEHSLSGEGLQRPAGRHLHGGRHPPPDPQPAHPPPGAPGPDSRPRKGDRLRAHQWHPNKSPYLSRIEDLPSKCEATGSNPVWRAKSPLKSVFQWAFFALLRRY